MVRHILCTQELLQSCETFPSVYLFNINEVLSNKRNARQIVTDNGQWFTSTDFTSFSLSGKYLVYIFISMVFSEEQGNWDYLMSLEGMLSTAENGGEKPWK